MLRKIAVSAASASALVLLLGNPAFAAGTWTVTGPTAPSTVAATSTNLSFTDTTAGITAACTSASASGSLPALSGTWDTTPVITNLGITSSGCSGLGIAFTLTQNGTAKLHVTGVTTGTGTSAVTPGEIRGLSVKATALGGLCTIQADGPGGANSNTGTIAGTYQNNGTLTTSGASNITIASASFGCNIGGLKKGDKAALTGTFNVTSTPKPVITAT